MTLLQSEDTQLMIGDFTNTSIRNCANAGAHAFDLIFADPPFNIGVQYTDSNDKMSSQHYGEFTEIWMNCCWDNLSLDGHFWVNVPDELVVLILGAAKRQELKLVNWIIWHYRFGQNVAGKLTKSKTHLLHFNRTDGRGMIYSDRIMVESDRARIYNDKRTKEKKDGSPDGMRMPFDVWGVDGDGPYWGRVQGNNAERRSLHPNQLPERLLERIILLCTNEGDSVLDPFCGSGTTSTVARALGRKSLTFEISETYAASAWERIIKIGPKHLVTEGKNNNVN